MHQRVAVVAKHHHVRWLVHELGVDSRLGDGVHMVDMSSRRVA